MQDYLLFQLYAPLVSWGEQAVGEERPSADHPSRSALLGLLAAALGIERENDQQHQLLANLCRFGSKQYATGLSMRDFHTSQVPPANKKIQYLTRREELQATKLNTILSFRSYQQDSLHIVALWLAPQTITTASFTMKQLQQALITPHYHLYLGRKSCPLAIALQPKIICTKTLKNALDSYPVDDHLMKVLVNKKIGSRYYWESPKGETDHSGLQYTYRVPRYDQPISRQRWQFASRDEYVYLSTDKEDTLCTSVK